MDYRKDVLKTVGCVSIELRLCIFSKTNLLSEIDYAGGTLLGLVKDNHPELVSQYYDYSPLLQTVQG